VAEVYERGRPDYAQAVVGSLAAELGLERGVRVLDLAAGTGKLTRALAAFGLDVVAVEPQAAMRRRLASIVGSGRVLEGVAESIPLGDDSVDAVTVADGFHWFDQPKALEDIHRVLRPRGGLAVLTTVPDWTGTSWAHEVGTMTQDLRPEHPFFDGTPWQDTVRSAQGWSEPREVRVTTSQPTEPSRIVDYVASMSFVAALPDDERREWLEKVARVIEAGETPSELPVHVVVGLTTVA